MTYPVIEAARKVLFLVTGEGKEDALRRLLSGDRSIPAGRIRNANTLALTDIELGEGAPR